MQGQVCKAKMPFLFFPPPTAVVLLCLLQLPAHAYVYNWNGPRQIVPESGNGEDSGCYNAKVFPHFRCIYVPFGPTPQSAPQNGAPVTAV